MRRGHRLRILAWIVAWFLLPPLVRLGIDWIGLFWFSLVWFRGPWAGPFMWEGRLVYKHWSLARIQMLTGAPCFEIPKNQLLTFERQTKLRTMPEWSSTITTHGRPRPARSASRCQLRGSGAGRQPLRSRVSSAEGRGFAVRDPETFLGSPFRQSHVPLQRLQHQEFGRRHQPQFGLDT